MRRPNFKREQETIHHQVITGKRCAQCLRPFNCGQRKYYVADKTYGLICSDCFHTGQFHDQDHTIDRRHICTMSAHP